MKAEGRSSTPAIKLGSRGAQQRENLPPPRIIAGDSDLPTACKSGPQSAFTELLQSADRGKGAFPLDLPGDNPPRAHAHRGKLPRGLERVPAQQLTSPFTVTQPFPEPLRVASHTFPSIGEFYPSKTTETSAL